MENPKLFINGRPAGIEAEEAKSVWQRFLGLMGKKEYHKALLLRTRGGIHTFFMRFPIDVIFLDRENRAVKIKENVRPGHIILPAQEACAVLELTAGKAVSLGLKQADIIELKPR